MAGSLPPPPVGAPAGSWEWLDWYRQIENFVGGSAGLISWNAIDTAGSNVTDLASRAHNDLQSHQGGTSGEYYHLTNSQHSALTTADSGWTDQTATASKANLGASPTNAQLASFCRALYDAIKAAGLISN